MVWEAPKASTLTDDFSTLFLNRAVWSYNGSGTLSIAPRGANLYNQGCQLTGGAQISSVNGISARRLDLFDSEVVFLIGSWSTGAYIDITQSNYSIRLTNNSGVLTVRSIEAGTTYTGANFLDGVGGTINWGQTIRYVRIVAAARPGTTTAKIDVYAGTKSDGSDQRLFTSDLGTGAKGTLLWSQSVIDNVTVTLNGTGTGNFTIQGVNAPLVGFPRSPAGENGYWLYRDFGSWHSYVTSTGWFTTPGFDQMSHEWALVQSATGGVSIRNASLTEKYLYLYGEGVANPTTIATAYPVGLRDLSYEVDMTPISWSTNDQAFGIFWRSNSQANSLQRYQLYVLPGELKLVVFTGPTIAWNTDLQEPAEILATVAHNLNVGQRYKIRIVHVDNKISVLVDGIERLSATDIYRWIRSPGQVGMQVVGTADGGIGTSEYAVHSVKAFNGYEELNTTASIPMVDRGLGVHVRSGRRDETQVTQVQNPSLVSADEQKWGVNLKTVYHFTDPSLGGLANGVAPVDTGVIAAAAQHGREGRVNVIAINSFNIAQGVSGGSNVTDGDYDAALLEWSNALNTIPGNLYVCLLPFPNLNVKWSPWSFQAAGTSDSTGQSTTTLQDSNGGMATDQFAGWTIRFHDGTEWQRSLIVSNTSTTFTFVSVGETPSDDQQYYLSPPTSSYAARVFDPAAYNAAYTYMVQKMKSYGCKAKYLLAVNWAHEIAWNGQSGKGYSTDEVLGDLYNDSVVDGILIRAIHQG